MAHFTRTPLAMAVACSLLTTVAHAQTTDNTSQSEQKIEHISVTGSQIKGVDLEGKQPLVVLNADDIAQSGVANLSELMQLINQTRGGSGSFTTSESGATSTSTPAGQAAASLRGLGPSATLTLINGRRVAASSFAAGTQNFVDINSIPLAAIDRVEVLASGASATYGADAVAGVINYILKKDYQGAEFNSSYSNSTASSADDKVNINAIWGGELAGGNLMVFADYFNRSALSAKDRAFTKDPLLVSNYSYLPKNTPNIYYYSSRSGDELANPNCATDLVTTEYGEQICAYYHNQDDVLKSALTTASAGFTYTKAVNDNIDWHTDFFYSHSKSNAISSPAPINQVDDSEGPWADESALDVFSESVRNNLLDQMYIDPFTTQAGQTLYGFEFDARFSEPREVEVKTDAFRLVSGLSGIYHDFDWETAATFSQSKSTQTAVNGVYNRYQYHGLLAGELCSTGELANYDVDLEQLSCSSGELLARYNPFLVGDSANDQLLAMAKAQPTRDGKSQVMAFDAKMSGDIFEWHDQTIRAAFGFDLRHENIDDIPSPNAQARAENGYLVDVFGFGSSLSTASRTLWGAFTELYVPLTDQLELQIAGRFDHYSDFGSTFNPKIAFSYRPINSLIFRGAWSTSFRAPSLTQAGVKLRTTTARYDCGANGQVAALYCENNGDERSVNVLELGNKSLKAEESEAISFGFGFSPSKDTTLTLDYWQFDHKKLVDTDMTAVMDAAISDASLRHCGLVPEGEMGISYDADLCLVTDNNGLTIEQDGANLAEILDAWVAFDDPRYQELPLYRDHIIQLTNTGKQTIKGIDLAFDQRFDFDQGTLKFNVDVTHYISFERNKAGSDQIESLIGTWRYPQNIASARMAWVQDKLYASISLNYTDSYQDDISGLRSRNIDELDALGVLDDNGKRNVASWTTVRTNIGYDFDNMNINLSINNLFDRNPPIAYGSSRGFDSINHDALGANYKLSFSYFFK